MMDGAKLRLSEAEMKLVQDASWILTKNSIMAGAVALMADLAEAYRPIWERYSKGEFGVTEPKISRGENCEGLPYVILDYPRFFGKADVFAIRTFFWWGRGFQLIFHVKGSFLEALAPRLPGLLERLGREGFLVNHSGDEWGHGLERYRPIVGGDGVVAGDWVKVTLPFGLGGWNEVPERMPVYFEGLLAALFAG